MLGLVRRYAQWLHLRWPAGTVEKFPERREDGGTRVHGVYVAGDLTGIPLLKFSLDSGVRAVRIMFPEGTHSAARGEVLDLLIIGAGVAGMAAAVEAKKRRLAFEIIEAADPFFTLLNFPKQKPIYTYPRHMTPEGDLQVGAGIKEALIDELTRQVERAGIRPRQGRAVRLERDGEVLSVHGEGGELWRARRVLVAIGRSGNFRRLGIPGEDLDKVYNRLHDPRDFAGQKALVVGGGDTAIEAAVGLALGGAEVTLSYRGAELSRPKPENLEMFERLRRDPRAEVAVEHPSDERATTAAGDFMAQGSRAAGSITKRLGTRLESIAPESVTLMSAANPRETIANDVVFVMIGREPPLEFFRRSGIAIVGEMTRKRWAALAGFLLFCAWLYDWKSGGLFDRWFRERHWFPYNLGDLLARAGTGSAAAAADPRTVLGTLAISAAGPAFWYTLAYSAIVVIFGARRIRRRRTPYVTAQTVTLMAVQVIPLFLLPEIVLPLFDRHGWLPAELADALFPRVDYGHGREFWRAYGLILAWPLNVYNIFTQEPLGWWIAIGVAQTLILIPLGIYFFGKGVYCGWICSCGALAETLGDTHRHKMPHGPLWNRMNLIGQGILAIAVVAPRGADHRLGAAGRQLGGPHLRAGRSRTRTNGPSTCSWPECWATGSTSGTRAACGADSCARSPP